MSTIDAEETPRRRFQNFHLQLLQEPVPQEHPNFEPLGHEFDTLTPETQNQIAKAITEWYGITKGQNYINRNIFQARVQVERLPASARTSERIKLREVWVKHLRDLVKLGKSGGVRVETLRGLYQERACSISLNAVVSFLPQITASVERLEGMAAKVQGEIDELRRKQQQPGANSKKARYMRPNENDQHEERERARYSALTGPFQYLLPMLTGHWTCIGPIGSGMADAALWVQVDNAGIVQRRIVRKDTPVADHEWSDARRWAGDPKNASGRVPTECHCQSKLQNCAEARNIVRAVKCEVDVKKSQHRLYTTYCPYGDLGGLIIRNHNPEQNFPEPWLWMVFSVLVDCGLIMEKGGLDDNPADGWKQVVHRDLKPANVFLDLGDASSWPRYPQPKLGDFGLAFETSEDDELNPQIWNGGAGTYGFQPPEQLRFMDSETREPVDAFQLLAHTNVWGVGAIMFCLVHNVILGYNAQPTYLNRTQLEYAISNDRRKVYRPHLLGLVQACLHFDPKRRPSFAHLRSRIDNVLGGGDHSMAFRMYMRNARDGTQDPNAAWDIFALPDEKYKIGMVSDALQPQKQPQKGVQSEVAGADAMKE